MPTGFTRSLLVVVLGAAGLWRPAIATADVKVPALFSDRAVFQRGQAVPIWGTADPGEQVTVTFEGQTLTTTAAPNGSWRIALSPLKEGTGKTLLVRGKNTITVRDVAVGEVWLASGQSNMQFRLEEDANGSAAIAAAADPDLRVFDVEGHVHATPLPEAYGAWVAAKPATAGDFFAVAYYFARELRKARKVPIGIMQAAVGASPAEAWTSAPALGAIAEMKYVLDALAADRKKYRAELDKSRQAATASPLEGWMAQLPLGIPLSKPDMGDDPDRRVSRPSGLYNGMIAPLQPYAMRGVIWYQGESNSGRAKQYRVLLPAMIADWRKAWGQGAFPFLFVQLPQYTGIPPEIREAQSMIARSVPHTAMVVTIDVGDPDDVHPAKKEPVGIRLAKAARATVYGETIEYSGPTFVSMSMTGAAAVLKFEHAGGMTALGGGALKGFTIAGADKRSVPATATIAGDTIIVSANGITKPVAVRYGWASVPDANLINGAGLPASPFRTDPDE